MADMQGMADLKSHLSSDQGLETGILVSRIPVMVYCFI